MLFNLRQLMQLESERVEAEDAAVRARAAAAEREHEAVERARVEEARRESQEALRLEREREAALLRAQLSAAADERLRCEGLALERARTVSEIEGRTRRARAAIAAAGLAFTLIGGAGAHAWLSAPRVVRSESHAPAVARPTLRADEVSELVSLREQLARLLANQPPQPQTAVAAPVRTPKRRIESKHARGSRAQPNPVDHDPLGPIDTNNGDPLVGM